jgi:NADH-quinone oxidoreductase subunit N
MIPAPLLALGILVLGAVVALLLIVPLSRMPVAAAALGLPFAIAAAVVALSADGTAGVAVAVLCGVAAIALLLLPALEAQVPAHVAESSALLLLGTAGAGALAISADLVQAVVGLETLALSAVTLVAIGAGDRPLEAAFKYFVLGAISLAALLYGLGLIYLGTGSFAFPTAAAVTGSTLVLAGVVLVVLGFAFELAVVPFHWGALDAYTAAAPALAGYVMSVSKLAAAYALGKLVTSAGVPVAQLLIWVGALTIVWGTFGALAQPGLRRMLAYSAITHAGFIALAAGSGPNGPLTAVFYAAAYASMAMLVFAALSGRGIETIDLAALGPVRAGALALGLFSLAGIPPTPGFWAKLAVLVAAWQYAGPLVTVIAVAGGVFSVLYYLRPVPDLFAAMRGGDATPRPSAVPAMLVAALAVVVLGLFPGLAWALAAG